MRKEILKGIHRIISTRQRPRAVAYDVHSGFDNALVSCMLARVVGNAEENWICPFDEEWINSFLFSSYYPKMVDLD